MQGMFLLHLDAPGRAGGAEWLLQFPGRGRFCSAFNLENRYEG